MAIYWDTSIATLKIPYGAQPTFGGPGAKLVTEYEYGPKSRRQRFTNIPFNVRFTSTFTDAGLDYLLAFYHTTVKDGTLSFIVPMLVGTRIQLARCYFDQETLSPVAETYNHWSVDLNIEVREVYAVSETVFWFINYFGEYSDDICNILQTVVNESWPAAVDDWDTPDA